MGPKVNSCYLGLFGSTGYGSIISSPNHRPVVWAGILKILMQSVYTIWNLYRDTSNPPQTGKRLGAHGWRPRYSMVATDSAAPGPSQHQHVQGLVRRARCRPWRHAFMNLVETFQSSSCLESVRHIRELV